MHKIRMMVMADLANASSSARNTDDDANPGKEEATELLSTPRKKRSSSGNPKASSYTGLVRSEPQPQNPFILNDPYCPPWNVVHTDSIRDFKVAQQVSNYGVLLPADRRNYASSDIDTVAKETLHYLAMGHSGATFLANMAPRLAAELDIATRKLGQKDAELAQANSDLANAKDMLSLEQDRYRGALREVNRLQALYQKLQSNHDKLEAKCTEMEEQLATIYSKGFAEGFRACIGYIHTCFPDIDISQISLQNYIKENKEGCGETDGAT